MWALERIPAWTWTKVAIVSTSVCETSTSDIYAHVHRRDTVCDVCSARHESSEVSCTYSKSESIRFCGQPFGNTVVVGDVV